MQGGIPTPVRISVFAVLAMLTTSAGSLAAQIPGPYLVDLRLCNGGDITIDAVVARGPRQENPRHTASGWYTVAPGDCEPLPHTVRTRYFSLAFKVSGTKQSVTLEENRGIELDKNSFHFIRPEELSEALGWVCVPEDFYSGFGTRFDTWDFGASCEAGFIRFPMSNSFQLTLPVEYTRVSIRITPTLAHTNRLDSRSTATPGDGGVYAGTGRDGNFHGYGVYRWPDGLWYEGEWRENQRHGNGVLVKPDGARCDGEWRDAVLQGTGTGREGGVEKPCYPSGYTFTFDDASGGAGSPGTAERAGAPSGRAPVEARPTAGNEENTPGGTGTGSGPTSESDETDTTAQGPNPGQWLREIAVVFPVLTLGYFLATRLILLLTGVVSGSDRRASKWNRLRWIHGLGALVALGLTLFVAPLLSGANAFGSLVLLLGPVLLVRAIDARRYRGDRRTEATAAVG